MDPLVRILIIDNSLGITGAFNSIFQSANRLKSNFQFYFLLPTSSGNVKQLTNEGFVVYQSSFIEISKSVKTLFYPFILVYNAIKLLNILRKQNIDIIHVNDIYNMVGVVAKILNPKIVLVQHVRLLPTSYVGKLYAFWRKILELFADEIICVSEHVSSRFIKRDPVLIYDTIELPSNLHTVEPPADRFNIIYVANYIEGKGQRQAIGAFNLAYENIKKGKLTFYGDTFGKPKNIKFKQQLKQYVEELGLRGKIEFKGFLNSFHEVVTDFDLALNFSESESFSMTTLEYLAYGIPLIATDSGGPSEIIENNKSGLLVPVNDVPAMAYGIIYLAEHEDVRELFTKNGKKRIEGKFNIIDQSNRLKEVYIGLLNRYEAY